MKESIICYEYEKLILSSNSNFTQKHLDALEKWIERKNFSEKENPYYTLIHNGVKFSSYVGMLQVGDLTIEILPKISKYTEIDSVKWKELLLKMLQKTKRLSLNETDLQYQGLSKRPLSEIFLKSFIKEVNVLIHKGFLKAYRKQKNNKNCLKGKIIFSQNLKHNLVHSERFYTESIVYDYQSYLNKIIITAIRSINHITCVKTETNRILSDWDYIEELDPLTIDWKRISFDRRTEIYKSAIIYAQMILNCYNPNLSKGSLPVISFMFDMNKLFEEYVYQILKHNPKYDKVIGQKGRYFWESNTDKVLLKPDILITQNTETFVLDTKWKLMESQRPSDADLRQIFAYCHLFDCKKGYLVYPYYDDAPEDLSPVQYKNDDCCCGMKFFNLFEESEIIL